MSIIDISILSLAAGLCTGVGGLIVVLVKKPGKGFLGGSVGFASGVMLVVAFLTLTGESIKLAGYGTATVGFIVGAILMLFLDRSLPHVFEFEDMGVTNARLYKVGLLTAVGIAIHNIPEGLAVSAGYARLPALGILVALSIAFHNIPEGIATGAPLYSAGMRARKVFAISSLSGLAEPLGALLGGLVLAGASTYVIALGMAFAGGIMTFITVDELIPTGHLHGSEHTVAFGLILGLAFAMFLSVLLGITA